MASVPTKGRRSLVSAASTTVTRPICSPEASPGGASRVAIRFRGNGAQYDFASTSGGQGEAEVVANHLHVGRPVGAYPSIGRQVTHPIPMITFNAIRTYQDEIVYDGQNMELTATIAIFYFKVTRSPRNMRYAPVRRLKWKSQPAQLIYQQGAAAAFVRASRNPRLPLGPSRMNWVFRNVRSQDIICELPACGDVGRFHSRLQSAFLSQTSGLSSTLRHRVRAAHHAKQQQEDQE
jgi:hypothetical protein